MRTRGRRSRSGRQRIRELARGSSSTSSSTTSPEARTVPCGGDSMLPASRAFSSRSPTKPSNGPLYQQRDAHLAPIAERLAGVRPAAVPGLAARGPVAQPVDEAAGAPSAVTDPEHAAPVRYGDRDPPAAVPAAPAG